MSGDVACYVVNIQFEDQTLTEINELSNHLTRAGFSLTLKDEQGKVHDLGTNTFGLTGTQDANTVKELAHGLAQIAVGRSVEVEVVTFEQWLKDQ
jgi:Protein of unknown function (DUF2622).